MIIGGTYEEISEFWSFVLPAVVFWTVDCIAIYYAGGHLVAGIATVLGIVLLLALVIWTEIRDHKIRNGLGRSRGWEKPEKRNG